MMPGLPDLQSLLQQAQQMQADMVRAQSELAQVEVTGHAGGGLVTATVAGDGQLKALVIDPSVVDPADVETLADLVIAAVRDATRAAAELAEQSMGSVTGGLADVGSLGGPGGFDLSAFGLPSLDGLLDEDDEDDDYEGDSEADDEDEADDDQQIDGEELNDMVDADVIDADVDAAPGAALGSPERPRSDGPNPTGPPSGA